MVYNELQQKNPHLTILLVSDDSFSVYGSVLNPQPYESLLSALKNTPIPVSGNIYVPAAEELETKSALSFVSKEHYGGDKAQIGYCNGHSHKINCVEYHDHKEINLADTDMVLFLGRLEDMDGQKLNTDRLKCYFVPAGTVLVLNTGTLHFAPCRVHSSGFCCGVILRRGTNAPISPEKRHGAYFAQGKWLIGHAESRQVREMNAFEGLYGINMDVNAID